MQSALEKEIRGGLRYVVVDFDHTICNTGGLFEMGGPMPGAAEFLRELNAMGLGVIIQSCRTSPSVLKSQDERDTQFYLMTKFMRKHGLYFDEIDDGSHGKRFGLCYVDDRGVAFEGDWRPVMQRIKDMQRAAHG